MLPKIKTFPLTVPGRTVVDLPEGSQPLGLFKQAALIARVRPVDKIVQREFLVATIGADLPDDVYLDLVSVTNNVLLFEVLTWHQLRGHDRWEFNKLNYWQLRDMGAVCDE